MADPARTDLVLQRGGRWPAGPPHPQSGGGAICGTVLDTCRHLPFVALFRTPYRKTDWAALGGAPRLCRSAYGCRLAAAPANQRLCCSVPRLTWFTWPPRTGPHPYAEQRNVPCPLVYYTIVCLQMQGETAPRARSTILWVRPGEEALNRHTGKDLLGDVGGRLGIPGIIVRPDALGIRGCEDRAPHHDLAGKARRMERRNGRFHAGDGGGHQSGQGHKRRTGAAHRLHHLLGRHVPGPGRSPYTHSFRGSPARYSCRCRGCPLSRWPARSGRGPYRPSPQG